MKNVARVDASMRLSEDAYDLADGADALLVCTEWNEFKQLDLPRLRGLMANPLVVDGRNIYDPAIMQHHGFVYRAVGRAHSGNNGN